MGSHSQENKLPIININTENLINTGTNSWISTSNEVRSALENYGCFVLQTDQISSSLRITMFNLSKQLYDLPIETKIKNTSDIIGFGYYGGSYSALPLLEYFGTQGADIEAAQNFTNLLWPSGNTSFCETLFNYTKSLMEMDWIVMRMVWESYGVGDEGCEALINSALHMVRFMKYKRPQKEEVVETGLLPHTDKNFLTVLDTDEVSGLEIETRCGDWISYERSPSTFLVIAGEAFMGWSNGRIYAPLHKVIMRYGDEQVRYSIGQFSFMRNTIEVPKELLEDDDDDDGNGKCSSIKFKPFNHLEFLPYCIGKEGRKLKWAIKGYCGTSASA